MMNEKNYETKYEAEALTKEEVKERTLKNAVTTLLEHEKLLCEASNMKFGMDKKLNLLIEIGFTPSLIKEYKEKYPELFKD